MPRCNITLLLVVGGLLLPAGLGVAAAEEMPETITVQGLVRDFRGQDEPGGHPDFEVRPNQGFARYSGNIGYTIGDQRKPYFTGAGSRVAEQWRDAQHRPICHRLYDPLLGDNDGRWGSPGTGGITSAQTFDQWYRDFPGVNLSMPLSITLVLQDNGHYVFDDELDPYYQALGGFFPIDDMLFGNTPNSQHDHNFHFTFELHLDFVYDEDGDQFFKFTGDDDVWVFINDECVIDLGGVHAAHDQFVDFDRLNLVHGQRYTLDLFFAERHRNTSNFRIETNLPVRTHGIPAVTAAFD